MYIENNNSNEGNKVVVGGDNQIEPLGSKSSPQPEVRAYLNKKNLTSPKRNVEELTNKEDIKKYLLNHIDNTIEDGNNSSNPPSTASESVVESNEDVSYASSYNSSDSENEESAPSTYTYDDLPSIPPSEGRFKTESIREFDDPPLSESPINISSSNDKSTIPILQIMFAYIITILLSMIGVWDIYSQNDMDRTKTNILLKLLCYGIGSVVLGAFIQYILTTIKTKFPSKGRIVDTINGMFVFGIFMFCVIILAKGNFNDVFNLNDNTDTDNVLEWVVISLSVLVGMIVSFILKGSLGIVYFTIGASLICSIISIVLYFNSNYTGTDWSIIFFINIFILCIMSAVFFDKFKN